MRVVLYGVAYSAAYILPAAALWGTLSVILEPLEQVHLLMPLIASIYALGFGVIETLSLPFRTPSLAWQVPEQWLQGRSEVAQAIIWGITLGPGWITVNPYAGIWLLPLLTTLGRNLLMAVVVTGIAGAIHGGARAIGVLRNSGQVGGSCSHLLILGQQLSWRRRDGLILLLVAGTLAAYLLTILQGQN